MVSLVLLTTEEVLGMNQFWHRLDAAWITEEMEPFEEVKPEHLFIKPLSRDTYYAKNPDIPRSESEDENTISLNSFKRKHCEWKAKAHVRRRHYAIRSKLYSSSCNLKTAKSYDSIKKSSRRVKSMGALNTIGSIDQDDKVNVFLQRLFQNIPPPPMEKLQTIEQRDLHCDSFSDILHLPDYVDFEREKIFQSKILRTTSTMKINYRKACNL